MRGQRVTFGQQREDHGAVSCAILVDGIQVGEINKACGGGAYGVDHALASKGIEIHERHLKAAKAAVLQCFERLANDTELSTYNGQQIIWCPSDDFDAEGEPNDTVCVQPLLDWLASSRETLAEATGTAIRSGQAVVNRASVATGQASRITLETAKAASQTTVDAGQMAATTTLLAGKRATRNAYTAGQQSVSRSVAAITPIAVRLSEITQSLLATHLSGDLNDLVQHLVQGPATIYDKAMDAEYIATHLGGANHRLSDGGHTLYGAWDAVQQATKTDPDAFSGEGILDKIAGTFTALVKDGSTKKGLPLFTWDNETYTNVANYLHRELGIPKDWFYDLNSYDPAELLSATIGTLVLAFRWNKAQAGEFARLSAGWIITGVVSRNPLILVVSVVALARAYHLAQTRDDYAAVVDGLAKGTVVSGVTISAVAAIGAGAAVPGLGLLVGITTGVLAHKAADRVSVSEISQFIAERTMSAAEHIKTTAAQATPPPH